MKRFVHPWDEGRSSDSVCSALGSCTFHSKHTWKNKLVYSSSVLPLAMRHSGRMGWQTGWHPRKAKLSKFQWLAKSCSMLHQHCGNM